MTPGGLLAARNDRTLRYTRGLQPEIPAGITSGPATLATIPGQIATLTAVNMLARAHPEIILALPDTPLLIPSPVGGTTLVGACVKLIAAISPDVAVRTARHFLPGTLSIGIGHDAGPATTYAGGARWTARASSTRPQPVTADPSSTLGAGLAVTLAAGYIFRVAIGLPAVADRGVSLWSLAPASEPTGPATFGPVAVGTAWLVGAGAVGSCLAWWLHFTGVSGKWTVIDGDFADDTNLNRSLGLFAAHTGPGGQGPVAKAGAAAALIPGAIPYPHWWEDWSATDPGSPDVLIPTANDRGIRPAIAAYGHPATIHATTSRDWTAELHRHLPGRDGCITCRLPERVPSFACATGTIPSAAEDDQGRDAALPFLSAAAGVLLLGGLLQLQHGRWQTHDRNHWRLWFDQSPRPLQSSYWVCSSSCGYTPAPAIRKVIHGATRWYQPEL
jgi:hypothetical protein